MRKNSQGHVEGSPNPSPATALRSPRPRPGPRQHYQGHALDAPGVTGQLGPRTGRWDPGLCSGSHTCGPRERGPHIMSGCYAVSASRKE